MLQDYLEDMSPLKLCVDHGQITVVIHEGLSF